MGDDTGDDAGDDDVGDDALELLVARVARGEVGGVEHERVERVLIGGGRGDGGDGDGDGGGDCEVVGLWGVVVKGGEGSRHSA